MQKVSELAFITTITFFSNDEDINIFSQVSLSFSNQCLES